MISRYYMVDKKGGLSCVIPSDARESYIEKAEKLRKCEMDRVNVGGIVYVRSLGVIEGGKK